jgi:hypothetical protein
MLDRPALILAAGEASRIGGICKQLLPASPGETILGRIIRQSYFRHWHPIIVTHNKEILGAFPRERRLIPARRRWTAETLRHSLSWASDGGLFLLGDVVYSRDLFDRLDRQEGALTFFGNEWEIYAIKMGRDGFHLLLNACDKAIWQESGTPGKGKLRRVWQAYVGLPLGDAFDKDMIEYVGSGDYTMDIDTTRDYTAFCNERNSRLDDLPGGEK